MGESGASQARGGRGGAALRVVGGDVRRREQPAPVRDLALEQFTTSCYTDITKNNLYNS